MRGAEELAAATGTAIAGGDVVAAPVLTRVASRSSAGRMTSAS